MNEGNILVVDDTRENLHLLSDMLSEHGYLVRPISNGRGAISSAQFSPSDLILLDILMPGMDDYEVCSEVRPPLFDLSPNPSPTRRGASFSPFPCREGGRGVRFRQ